MAYNEVIANQVRLALQNEIDLEEKKMFGGLCFMVNGKMCIGIVKDELMCRLHPDKMETYLEKTGCRPMDFTGKSMKGFVYVDDSGFRTQNELNDWVKECLSYNPLAKMTKKKTKSDK